MAIGCPPNCIKGTPVWNLYDVTDTNPEFCLYESVVGEYNDIAGFPVLYYRAKSNMDRLYGEDSNQNYYEAVQTKLVYEPTEEPNIIDGLGIRSDETLQYSLIPKSTFTRDIGGTVDGVPETITVTNVGSNYTALNNVLVTGGTGTGLRVSYTVTGGVITKVTLDMTSRGSEYTAGDVITIPGGDVNATFTIDTVTTMDIQPMPGDVIKTLWNNRNYEIVDIGAEQNIFMARKLIWEFILRPYRFSEQSDLAEEIHRSQPVWVYISIYPDGEYADVTYPDGTEMIGVPVDTLDIDLTGIECGYKYRRNDDGTLDIITTEMETEADEFPHPTYEETGLPLEDKTTKAYGDNSWIEVESDQIDTYGDIDTVMFSTFKQYAVTYGASADTPLTQSIVNGFDIVNVLNGSSYQFQFDLTAEYIYIVIPVAVNEVSFTINGLEAIFIQTTGNFLYGGESYTSNVYQSQFQINGQVTVQMTPV